MESNCPRRRSNAVKTKIQSDSFRFGATYLLTNENPIYSSEYTTFRLINIASGKEIENHAYLLERGLVFLHIPDSEPVHNGLAPIGRFYLRILDLKRTFLSFLFPSLRLRKRVADLRTHLYVFCGVGANPWVHLWRLRESMVSSLYVFTFLWRRYALWHGDMIGWLPWFWSLEGAKQNEDGLAILDGSDSARSIRPPIPNPIDVIEYGDRRRRTE